MPGSSGMPLSAAGPKLPDESRHLPEPTRRFRQPLSDSLLFRWGSELFPSFSLFRMAVKAVEKFAATGRAQPLADHEAVAAEGRQLRVGQPEVGIEAAFAHQEVPRECQGT